MKKLISIALLFLSMYGISLAQSNNDPNVSYRVIAVKSGDSTIISESNTVTTKPLLFLQVPNAFTPNNDGLNDTFGAVGYGVETYSMKIFNRWGELLFETNNFNDPWDGNYNGQKVMPGSYIYEIKATGSHNKSFQKKGTVTIIKN